MPIYAYKCESCGLTRDVLQKISDAPLVECPGCGQASFKKQLTAAGFQLKGSGWYATDFRGGATAPQDGPAAKPDADKPAQPSEAAATKPESTAQAAPTGGCGGGCACH